MTNLNLDENALTASDPALLSWLATKDHNWVNSQTVTPSKLEAPLVTASSVVLSWDPGPHPFIGSRYEVQLAFAATGPFVPIRSVRKTRFTMSPPYANRVFFRVRTFTPKYAGQKNDLWSDFSPTLAVDLPNNCSTLTLHTIGLEWGAALRALPFHSPGCRLGEYRAGESIIIYAAPSDHGQVIDWDGLNFERTEELSTTTTYWLTMPPEDKHIAVQYGPLSNTTPKDWLFLVYAAGDNNLAEVLGWYREIPSAPNEKIPGMLHRVRTAGGQSNAQLAVLYDGKRASDSRLRVLEPSGAWKSLPISALQGNTSPPTRSGLMMDSQDTLRDFVSWGLKTYPNRLVYLVIADHASGIFGIAEDRTTGVDPRTGQTHYLTPSEIYGALKQAKEKAGRYENLDIIHFDGCAFGLFEDASIVDGIADYVIASPNTGWGVFAYEEYRRLAAKPNHDPRSLAREIGRFYARKVREAQLPYTISVFDMAHYQTLYRAMDSLGSALVAYQNMDSLAGAATLTSVRNQVQSYDSSGDFDLLPSDRYVDVRHLAQMLTTIEDANVAVKAQEVVRLARLFVAHERHTSGSYTDPNQGRDLSIDLTNSGGLAIYYPQEDVAGEEAYCRYVKAQAFPALKSGWGWIQFLQSQVPVTVCPEADAEGLNAPLLLPDEPLGADEFDLEEDDSLQPANADAELEEPDFETLEEEAGRNATPFIFLPVVMR